MLERSVFAIGVGAMVLGGTAAAVAAPSYCPTGSYAACGGREVGDILVGLHSKGRVFGIRPSTGEIYTFSTELEQYSNIELGDLAVVPNDPLRVVVIGNVDQGIGIRQLDSCGNLTSAVYGPFPESLSYPWPPLPKGGTNLRGLVFNPLSGTLYAPSGWFTTPFYGGPDWFSLLYAFPQGGGPLTIEGALATGEERIDGGQIGAVAADELGTLYVGNGDRLGRMTAVVGGSDRFAEYVLSGEPPTDIKDIVHDGDQHLYVTGAAAGHGMIWRVDTLSGVSELWAPDRGPSYDDEPYNLLWGITLDAQGDILAVEQFTNETNRAGVARISRNTGQMIEYFGLPVGTAETVGAGNQPWAVTVLGVNLPAVREACSSDCGEGYISNCYGGCTPGAWLGDDFCDEGSLTCWSRASDWDDCALCPDDQVRDCNGHCALKSWVGDDICDQGGYVFEGNWISFDCEAFRFDEATCRGCGWGEMLDCNGNCSPESWHGDGICDDGDYWHFDHPVDYDCVEYDFDGNDCQVGG